MPASNAQLARLLAEVGDVLEMKGANPFRVRAYRNAARALERWEKDIAAMVASGEDLTQIPGIGKDLAAKLTEAVETGRIAMLDREKEGLSPGVRELLSVPGLGPKRVQRLVDRLHVRDVAGLQAAAQAGKVRGLPGFGESLERHLAAGGGGTLPTVRWRWVEAERVAASLVPWVLRLPGVTQAEAAGSYRRRKATVADLDIVAAADDPASVTDAFARHPGVERVLSKGPTRCTAVLPSGFQVDVRAVPDASYGAALLYFTGSKEHNVALRDLARARKWKLNEYGLWDGDARLAGRTEEDVYRALGLDVVPPELREGYDEVELAAAGKLPRLVEWTDLKGDLHMHTDASDGAHSLERMLKAAERRGLQYVAVTEHSPRTSIANGLPVPVLERRLEELDRMQRRFPDLRILKGAEVDILPGGRLDYPDDVLAKLDVVVCSLHHRGRATGTEWTEAMIAAMGNRYATVLGHPSGRRIPRREPLELDIERLLDAAAADGWAVESNGQPERLDLWDTALRMARERKVPVAADSDAHSVQELMEYGRHAIAQCRRGGLRRLDVLNARPLARFERYLEARRA